jgi:hypothetical protein
MMPIDAPDGTAVLVLGYAVLGMRLAGDERFDAR